MNATATLPRNGVGCKNMNDRFNLAIELMLKGPRDFGEGDPVKLPVTVYRVEMPNGHGPYNSELPNSKAIYEKLCSPVKGFDCAYLANLNREQCGTSESLFYHKHGDASYCCDSLDSLYRWFPLKARKYLQSYGAVIVQYTVPVGEPLAYCGNGELVFNKKTAIKEKTIPIV